VQSCAWTCSNFDMLRDDGGWIEEAVDGIAAAADRRRVNRRAIRQCTRH
jgi:hypothetical protein